MITRAQYMNNEVTHRQFYGQFVTPEFKQVVSNTFGKEILAQCLEKDQNLNNIPLAIWDGLAGGYESQLYADKLRLVGDGPSLAGAVCILKEAAKQVVEENS